MWGAGLFFLTILMVTESGRAVIGAYLQQTFSISSLPDPILAVMVLSGLASLLLMIPRAARKPAEVRLIWRRVRGELPDDRVANPAPTATFVGRPR